MEASNDTPSRAGRTAGWILTGVVGLFMLVDGGMKVAQAEPSIEGTLALGYGAHHVVPIGAVLLVCTALYLVPRTAVLGGLLLTAYLGGAVASHVRADQPLFTLVFAIVFGVMVWASLGLRAPRLRAAIFGGV